MAGLLFGIAVSLVIYYEVREKDLAEEKAALSKNLSTIVIQADTIVVTGRSGDIRLLPVPRKYEMQPGFYQVPENLVFSITGPLNEKAAALMAVIGLDASHGPGSGDLAISSGKGLPEQGYRMDIQPGKILIEYADDPGLFYALTTFKILKNNYNGLIPCMVIEDYPDLPVRGVMLDISRDKVPSLETLKELVGLLADLKFNHLELYVEGFSFAYPTYSNLWEGRETPMTGEEIRSLDSLCRDLYIDLVPNQNSLGHMTAWLATDQFSGLAECPDGYKFMGLIDMKGTLDPSDPRSLELVTTMTDELLPHFTSEKFNVNLDEPFELGKGKSRKLVEKSGVEGVYLDYTLKMHEMVSKRNKKMLMWGDIALRHPDMLKKIPHDITLLDWGYEANYPFEKNCRLLQSSGLSYMVCPGTSSWTSITGRTDNMLGNIASAVSNGVKYQASGMLLTDWGDMGHWQYLPVSYPGFVTAGSLSWNSKTIKELPLVPFLNSYVFKDERQIMGDLVLDLGKYRHFEEVPVPNMTTTMLALQFGLNDRLLVDAIYEKISVSITELMKELAPELIDDFKEKFDARKPFDFEGLLSFLDEKEAMLGMANMKIDDNLLISNEYMNAIRLLKVGTNLQFYIEYRNELSVQERKAKLDYIQTSLQQYLVENQKLWASRNKHGGYDRSVKALNNLVVQIDKEIKLVAKPAIFRVINRLMEKVTTAAAVIYITKIA